MFLFKNDHQLKRQDVTHRCRRTCRSRGVHNVDTVTWLDYVLVIKEHTSSRYMLRSKSSLSAIDEFFYRLVATLIAILTWLHSILQHCRPRSLWHSRRADERPTNFNSFTLLSIVSICNVGNRLLDKVR